MSIRVRRHHRPKRYTEIENEFIRQPFRTATAFHVAVYLMSHAEWFEMTNRSIAKVLGYSEDTVGNAVRELEQMGYLLRTDVRNARGHRIGTDMLVSDVKFTDEERETLAVKVRVEKNVQTEDDPATGSPTGKIWVDKKTNSIEEDQSLPEEDHATDGGDSLDSFDASVESTPGLGAQRDLFGGARAQEALKRRQEADEPAAGHEVATADFDAFWATWPRKERKRDAVDGWPLAVRRAGSPQRIIEAAAAYAAKVKANRTEARYVMQAVNWLRQTRWLDEAPTTEPVTGQYHRVPVDDADSWAEYEDTPGGLT